MNKDLLYIIYGNNPKTMVQKALDQTNILDNIPSKDKPKIPKIPFKKVETGSNWPVKI